MKHFAAFLMVSFLGLFAVTGVSFCQETSIKALVDKYIQDTDLQRARVEKEYEGKSINLNATVYDVGEGKTFDVANDIERVYYTVTTDVIKTPAGNPYRAILVYKDMDKVKDLTRGQTISFSGNIIRVVNEGLYISVWLSADKLTPEERVLFK